MEINKIIVIVFLFVAFLVLYMTIKYKMNKGNQEKFIAVIPILLMLIFGLPIMILDKRMIPLVLGVIFIGGAAWFGAISIGTKEV